MKSLLSILLSLVLLSFFGNGCKEIKLKAPGEAIVHEQINQQIVLIRDVQTLQASNDAISKHVDSILQGLIQADFVSTGQKDFYLFSDEEPDVAFEIIDLNKFNPNGLPQSFDTLAARVIPKRIEILDNSTYGYPDALDLDELISDQGNWSTRTSVLGTFLNAGQFQGAGEKYLAIRFPKDNGHKYGWVKIYCSQHNDTLRIIDFAYNDFVDGQIKAGQID